MLYHSSFHRAASQVSCSEIYDQLPHNINLEPKVDLKCQYRN